MNAQIYLRGARVDFDEWAANGASGWSYDEVLPYFRKAEQNERGETNFMVAVVHYASQMCETPIRSQKHFYVAPLA